MLLEKKPTQALERLQRSTGLPAKQIVAQLLIDAAADLREAKARLTDAQIKTIRKMEPQGFRPTRSIRSVLKPTVVSQEPKGRLTKVQKPQPVEKPQPAKKQKIERSLPAPSRHGKRIKALSEIERQAIKPTRSLREALTAMRPTARRAARKRSS
jgi:hypothetical protein